MALTLTEAQRTLLGIIASVEAGLTEPDQAVQELTLLKQRAKEAGLKFEANYDLADFQRIRQNVVEDYESSTPYIETSYESSYEVS